MTGESRVTMRKGAAALIGVVLLFTGAGASYLFMRSSADMPERMDASAVATAATPPSGPSTQGISTETARAPRAIALNRVCARLPVG